MRKFIFVSIYSTYITPFLGAIFIFLAINQYLMAKVFQYLFVNSFLLLVVLFDGLHVLFPPTFVVYTALRFAPCYGVYGSFLVVVSIWL